jgi:hypothetical protein
LKASLDFCVLIVPLYTPPFYTQTQK